MFADIVIEMVIEMRPDPWHFRGDRRVTRANFWLGFPVLERQLFSVAMRHVFVLLAILAATAVNAQDAAEISGVVRDSSQAPVAGVRITVINQATRSEAISYTDKDGFYRASSLEPQYYTVEALRLGLQTVIRRDLHVRPGARLRLDLELALASGGWSMPAPGTLGSLFLAPLMAALILLFITEPGRKILQKLWGLVEWAGDKVYELCAPRFPNWIGLAGYRKRVQRDPILGRIEHPVGPEESEDFKVMLEQAFAPLAVMSGNSDDRLRTDLFSFAAAHRRFLVLGGPGTGKTTLMKNLVISILNQRATNT